MMFPFFFFFSLFLLYCNLLDINMQKLYISLLQNYIVETVVGWKVVVKVPACPHCHVKCYEEETQFGIMYRCPICWNVYPEYKVFWINESEIKRNVKVI